MTTTYGYDNNGNMTSKTTGSLTEQYTYDGLSRLTAYSNGTTTASYTYDAQNRRRTKTVNGATTMFEWFDDNLAMEERPDTTITYYYGTEGIVLANFGTHRRVFEKNPHGDVIGVDDVNGLESSEYTYDSFGNHEILKNQMENALRYAGEYYDNETGLIYLRNRYYDPSMGRFITEDPHWNTENMIYGDKEYEAGEIKIPDINAILQSSNLYSYSLNNPIKYVDSTGESVKAYGIGVSVGIGGAGYEGMYLWATDDKGNFALIAINGYSATIGASLNGVGIYFPDMPNVSDMYGYGFGFSGSLNGWGAGLTFGGNKGQYTGYVIQGGIGAGADVWTAGDGSYAQPIFSGNIYSIPSWMKNILNKILPKNLKV